MRFRGPDVGSYGLRPFGLARYERSRALPSEDMKDCIGKNLGIDGLREDTRKWRLTQKEHQRGKHESELPKLAAAVHQFHHAHRRIHDCSRSACRSVPFIVGHVAASQVVDRI